MTIASHPRPHAVTPRSASQHGLDSNGVREAIFDS